MNGRRKEGRWLNFFSGLYVLIALVLLLWVCSCCYPAFREKAQEVFVGLEDGTVRRAFGTLAEGLENGEPVKETFAETAQVLLGETD